MGHSKGSPERKVYNHESIFKKTERSQISDLMLHLKLLDKQQKTKAKTNRRREIIKIRAEINEIVTQKNIKRINETKSWFFEKINKDRHMANLAKMRREKTQISQIRNVKGEITTNSMEAQEIFRDYFNNLYCIKYENLEDMDRFPDTYDHRKLIQKNRSITQKEIKAAIISQK
jgi:hypothetical protein